MILLYDATSREIKTWTHCELEGLCFFISIRCMHTGQQDRVAIVQCAHELRHYLEAAKDVEIHHVQMLCPPLISGQSQWTLEDLESVTIYTGVNIQENAVVYRTKERTYKLGELDLRRKKQSRRLYSSSRLSSRTSEPSDNLPAVQEVRLYSSFLQPKNEKI